MKKLIIGLVAGLLIGSIGTAAANSPTVQAVFSKFVLQVEDKQHNIEPLVHQGTTYLPVREVAGLLGYDVEFKNATKTIQLKGAENVSNVVTDNNTMHARDLIELLGIKYPELTAEQNMGKSLIFFDSFRHELGFGDKRFILEKVGDGYSVEPLIAEGILELSDLNLDLYEYYQ